MKRILMIFAVLLLVVSSTQAEDLKKLNLDEARKYTKEDLLNVAREGVAL